MKVSRKLLIAPLVAIGFLIVLALASYYALQLQQNATDDFYRGVFKRYESALQTETAVGKVHAGIYRLLNISDAIGEQRAAQEAAVYRKQLATAQASFKRVANDDSSEEIKAAGAKLAEYAKAADLAIELGSVDVNTGTAAMLTADQAYQDMAKHLTAVVENERKVAADIYARTQESYRRAWITMLLLAAAAVVASLAVATLQARAITSPLRIAMTSAEALSRGDLTRRVMSDSRDEVGQLVTALGDSTVQLARLVGAVRQVTNTITTASREIADGNNQLSHRTESQASSLEETASSMEELTSTVTHNADNATRASQLVQSASEVAAKGGEVVASVVHTMEEITRFSSRIADITGVIDGIAFQTNILALNAAVEAARAGDQGRGFAVVATEVRGLAQRSATAAKEIKALIGESVGKVDAGAKLAAQAGKTMEEVVAAVRKVADITSQIKDASREQATGIQQVNQAVTEMDHVTQQNAALVEQVSAASASLRDQAEQLNAAVVAFKLEGGGGAEHESTAAALEPVALLR